MIHPTLRVSRRALLGSGLAVPVAALAAACSDDAPATPGPSGSADAVTYLTNFQQLGRDSYAYLALEQGGFASTGMTVTIQPGTGTVPNIAGLLSGRAQFATVDLAGAAQVYGTSYEGPDEEIEQELGGRRLEGIVTIAAIHQRALAAVMAYEDAGIAGGYDLAGRKVGLPVGAVTDLLFPAYLEAAGVPPEEVERVPLEAPALVPALASGQVDAIGQFVVGRPLVEAAGDGRAVVVLPYDEYLSDLYGVGLCTTTELAESNPDLCARFRDALLGGLQAAMADPDAAAEALTVHNPETTPEVAAAEMREMVPYSQPSLPDVPLGHIESARLARHIATLTSAGLRTTPLDPEALADFSLVPGAGA